MKAPMATKNKAKMEMDKPGKGGWIDKIHSSIGHYVSLETTDGIRRHGRLTGVRSDTMLMNGAKVEIIRQMELNGDPSDLIDLWRLVRIDVTEGS